MNIFKTRWLIIILGVFLLSQAVPSSQFIQAGMLTFVSDTISTSAPNQNANHAISFIVGSTVPASGYIKIDFPSGLTIPSGFVINDIDLLVDGAQRNLASTPSGSTVGVTITTGNGGEIIFQLGSSAIGAGSEVVVRLGTNAIYDNTQGTHQIANSSSAGPYLINIQTRNSSNSLLDEANAIAVIIAQVNASSSFGTVTPPPSGGGGGGGGGATSGPTTQLNISGRAYPSSKVYILKDGQLAATTVSDPAARFEVSLTTMTAGSYNIGIYTEDSRGIRSPIESFPVTFTTGSAITVGSIFLPPTIQVDKSQVKRGDNVALFGQSVNQGEITISIHSNEFFVKTNSDQNGTYLYNLDTSTVDMGDHTSKSKSAKDGQISNYGNIVNFKVGDKNVDNTGSCRKADLNNDGRVNLVDFSIAAFWYKRSLSGGIIEKESCALNNDKKIDLVDFSIIAYHWTG